MLLDADSKEITSVDLAGDAESATVVAEAGKPCYVAVWLNKYEKITLCSIDFEVIR